jgi:chemotaxis protein methyltransferase CheR
MNTTDFEFVAHLARQRSGLVLTPEKTYLVESRLAPLARREGLASTEDLVRHVRARRDERLVEAIIDAMTTNETFFFRDKTPFDLLKEAILPALAVRRGPSSRLRILCAAASTGQEPYSIAMLLDQNPGLTHGAQVEIIATDISDRVLEKAKAGIYSQFEVQRGLPIQMLMKYFDKDGETWRINDRLKSHIQFRRHNLLDDMRSFGKFDVVFCRNVLIYFDQPTKRAVLEKIAAQLAPDGFLVMGAAETVLGITTVFEPARDRRGLYVRSGQSQVAAA